MIKILLKKKENDINKYKLSIKDEKMNNEEEKNMEICNDNNINDLKSFKNIKKC